VVVDDRLHPAGHPEIFICGDLAAVMSDGKPVPGVAQPAMQMGDYAGKSIALEAQGKQMQKPFHYFDKGDMATIGRKAAVANVKWPFKGHLSGFFAWFTWLTVHIFFLIGFRNRFSVFRSWAWTYAFFEEGSRLIVGDQTLPGWDVQDKPEGHLTTQPIDATNKEEFVG
jgi:NADH dehydrogenase